MNCDSKTHDSMLYLWHGIILVVRVCLTLKMFLCVSLEVITFIACSEFLIISVFSTSESTTAGFVPLAQEVDGENLLE